MEGHMDVSSLYTGKKGTQWAACAADMGAGHWAIKENFLFKVA